MADFVETINTKSAVRDLAVPFADIAAFDAIVTSVIDDNPFGCTAYDEGGETKPPVGRTREQYNAKVIFEDPSEGTVGAVSARTCGVAAFSAAAAEVMGDAALAGAIGGAAVRDADHDTFLCRIRCHDPSGEIYYVTFTRTKVRISSYEDDAIRDTVEAWADSVPLLA